jgi:DNA-binding protein HU-beta
MNKTEFVERLADNMRVSKAEAAELLEGVLALIKRELKRGGNVTLTGFGTFEVRKRKERKGRNPKTGEVINIKASKAAAFKPGKVLKDAVS